MGYGKRRWTRLALGCFLGIAIGLGVLKLGFMVYVCNYGIFGRRPELDLRRVSQATGIRFASGTRLLNATEDYPAGELYLAAMIDLPREAAVRLAGSVSGSKLTRRNDVKLAQVESWTQSLCPEWWRPDLAESFTVVSMQSAFVPEDGYRHYRSLLVIITHESAARPIAYIAVHEYKT